MANLQRAIEIAVEAHSKQLQKNGLPYVMHPLTLMLSMTTTETRMAAVLHDVVEDTEWTLEGLAAEGFPLTVLAAIELLTHAEGVSYDSYIEKLKGNSIARAVKLADLKDNMNLLRIPEPDDKDMVRLKKYRKAWSVLEVC